MNIILTTYVGPMRLRLIEKPSTLEPDFFASRYYLDARHRDMPGHTGIMYLDHHPTHARRLFDRRVDSMAARLMAEQDAGQ